MPKLLLKDKMIDNIQFYIPTGITFKDICLTIISTQLLHVLPIVDLVLFAL